MAHEIQPRQMLHYETVTCQVYKIPRIHTWGKTLLETKSHSYLGVCINNKLNWNQHIQEITANAN